MGTERLPDEALTEIMGDTTWQDQVLIAAEHWPETDQESLFELLTGGDEKLAENARNRIIGRLALDAEFMPTNVKPSEIGFGTLEWRALSMWVGYSPRRAADPMELSRIVQKLQPLLEATHRSLGEVIVSGFTKLMQAERQAAER